MPPGKKLLLAAAVSALILASALGVVLVAWFFLGGNSNPSPSPAPAQTTVAPEIQPIRLEIKATIDGSDVLNITPDGVTLRHISWQPPPFMTLNDKRFYPDSHRTLEQIGLSQADLSTATVTSRHGRGTIALEKTSTGIAVHFADPQAGAAPFRMALTFLPKSAQPLPPSPATLPANSIFLDIKASIGNGSDILTISPTGATWNHVAVGWPSNIQINDHPWDVAATHTFSGIDFSNLDFSAAQVESQSGRDTLVMEKADNALNIYFCDTRGGSDYEIKIRVPRMK